MKLAAVQMIAAPAPIEDRLRRAEALTAQAAEVGSQLVVLPELFNTGYEYSLANYERAESLNGPTVSWMKRATIRYGVHMSGSLLLREGLDIYNALLLCAPEGRTWRYDKTFPWQWERAYFRPGRGPVIAETSLGRLGLLICWDVTHPRLWAQYAGQVDAMVISSCPPAMHRLAWVFPDGTRLLAEDAGPIMCHIQRTAGETYGRFLRHQTTWLGVPVVHTTGTGYFVSHIPEPGLSLALYALSFDSDGYQASSRWAAANRPGCPAGRSFRIRLHQKL
jgi:predicted amidohydrolase